MGILDDVPGIIAGAAGDLLFKDAVHTRTTARTSDGRGGFTETTANATVRALLTDYTAFQRLSLGIPSNERKILVLGHGLDPVPVPGDTITYEGYAWSVVETSRDPAKAVYECRCK
ncbi:MAG TPA: hypothetical protein PLR76_09900 [Hyphomonas sp.]|nr:hypothetical protein [Hyphomonas sp.]